MNKSERIYEDLLANKLKFKDDMVNIGASRYTRNSFPDMLASRFYLETTEAKDISEYIFNKFTTRIDEAASGDDFNLDDWIRGHLIMNDVQCNFNGTWDIEGQSVDQKEFISRIFLDLDRINQSPPQHMVGNSLYVWECEQIRSFEERMMEVIKYDKEYKNTGEAELARYVYSISSDDEVRNKIHLRVIQHIMWQIKRKLMEDGQYQVDNHLMINLYGETRAGKSVAVKKLLNIVWELTYENGTMKMFSDNRELFLLQKHYVILLEELEGADRTDVSALKRVMTSNLISYRMLGFNKNETANNKATFLATANTRIKDTIYDPTSAGRYWEINCRPKVEFKKNWDTINDINYISIWKSVDEKAESPIKSIIDEIQKIQAVEFKAQTHFEIWLDEQMITPIARDEEEAQEVDVDVILNMYNSNCSDLTGFKKVSKPIAGRDLVRLGFVSERIKTEEGRKTIYYIRDEKSIKSFIPLKESIDLDEDQMSLSDIHKIYGVNNE